MAQNMYRVGDYVYFELSSASPLQIRRIEELYKTPTGNVEVKVTSFYRRRDIPNALLKVADRSGRSNSIAGNSSVSINRRRIQASSATSDINGGESDDSGTYPTLHSNNDDSIKEENDEKDEKDCVQTEVKDHREESESPKPMLVDVREENDDEDNKFHDQNDNNIKETEEGGYGPAGLPTGSDALPASECHTLRQRELFLSRQVEALSATHIRGKCSVTLLSEVESPYSYLNREDAFFYSLVYDPLGMTLLADKGEIRIGDKYQCMISDETGDRMENEKNEDEKLDKRNAEDNTIRELLVYHPYHSLTDRDIDQFLIVARAVGTFSRALDTSSAVKLPSLHMTAAAASRDVTLLHAMAILHQADYDLGQAVRYLVPPPSKQHYPLDADKTTTHHTVSLGGPILCRDQIEEWSAAEANLFEEAIERYGKDFNDIRADYLPWKSLKDIIEFYYMWKTTNRYVDVKKSKALDQESKLKQVYIPCYNKPNPNLIGQPNPNGEPIRGTSDCESCQMDMSTQWFVWGPSNLHLRLCNECWAYWKKYGGLKRVHEHGCFDIDVPGTQEMQVATEQNYTNKGVPATSQSVPVKLASTSFSSASSRNGASFRSSGNQIVARLTPSVRSSVETQQKTQMLSVPAKTRVAFFLNTTLSTRIARRLAPKNLLNPRRSARRPFLPINGQAIKEYCTTRQPIEIIRTAKQIKQKRIPDTFLSQLAVSIISSGSHVGSISSSSSLKRPSSAAERSCNPKKSKSSSSATASSFPAVIKVQSAKNASSTSSFHGNEVKPVATVPPFLLPPTIVDPLDAINSIHSSLLGQSAVLPTVSQNVPLLLDRRSLAAAEKALVDSKWNDTDDRIFLLAGPRLKSTRQLACNKRITRSLALHPCRANELINQQWNHLPPLFE